MSSPRTMSDTPSRAVSIRIGVWIPALRSLRTTPRPSRPREHDVKHDRVVRMGSRSLQAARAVALYIHGVAVLGEPAPQQLSHPCVVFDDQYAHLFALPLRTNDCSLRPAGLAFAPLILA